MKNRLQKDAIYETIFKTHYSKLFYYVLRHVNNVEIAADITNDVFCNLWESYDQLNVDTNVLPWLYALARNYSVNYVRHREVEQKNKSELRKSDLYDGSIKDVMEHEQRIDQIMQKIKLLPPQTRKVFDECFMKERKYKEVAEEFDVSINTVKTLVMRALQFLRGKENE